MDETHVTGNADAGSAHEDRLVIEPAMGACNFAELVAAISDRNRHAATDWGTPIGCEEP